MEFDPWTARCTDCDYSEAMPSREHAAHAKRVHEDETGHTVFLEEGDNPD